MKHLWKFEAENIKFGIITEILRDDAIINLIFISVIKPNVLWFHLTLWLDWL